MKEHASFNRCYRLLWSGTTEQWKPVPETARTAKKGGRGKAANTLTLAGVLPGVAMSLFVMSNLAAQPPPAPPTPPATTQLPTGGNVVGGQATISQSAIATAANMVVNQTSQRAVIDWSNFNVGSGATVQFVQPNAQSVILNRVLDANPTQVFGRINANGQVFLTNPYGVYFAPSASVDVGGLVATTYSISNDDFMAGRYTFNRNGSTARVVNEGNLSASLGGYIALLAPEVQNSGVVLARAGTVAMAAGEQVSLTMADGKGLSGITTTASAIASLIDNKLAVQAPDGQIILSAVAVNKLQGGVIKNSGSLAATSLSNQGGKIVLEGDEIELTSTASIDVSGRTRGGTVLMGGDWQGSGNLRQATKVSMATGATINANATDSGDGGKVVLWSNVSDANSTTTVAGSIYASAGPNGGNGGQIETSGHYLNVDGIQVSTLASKGTTGEWLLDPSDITISSGANANYTNTTGTFTPNTTSAASVVNNATLATALASTNVTITTTNSGTAGSGTGNINIASDIAWTSNKALTLVAAGEIYGTGNISSTNTSSSVNFNQSGTSTGSGYAGNITGGLAVNISAPGKFLLTGTNTYSGITSLTCGTLAIQSESALGTNATVNLDPGVAVDFQNPGTLTKAYYFRNSGNRTFQLSSGNADLASTFANSYSGNLTLDIASGSLLTWSGNITSGGNVPFIKEGLGNVLLTKGVGTTNQSIGPLSVNNGTMTVFSDVARSISWTLNVSSAAKLIIKNYAVVAGNGFTYGSATTKLNGTLEFDPYASGLVIASGGNLTGAGNLVLSNTDTTPRTFSWPGFNTTLSTFSGNITINSGITLDLYNTGIPQTGVANIKLYGNLSMSSTSSSTPPITANISGNGNINVTGIAATMGTPYSAYVASLSGNNSAFTGAINIDTYGRMGVTSNLSLGSATITNNGSLYFDSSTASTFTVTNTITGTGNIFKWGANSTYVIDGSTNITGNLCITGGTLKLGSHAVFGNVSNGTYAGGINITGATSVFDDANASPYNLTGVISGNGTFNVSNANTNLTLMATNTFTGSTNFNGNTLFIGAGGSCGSLASSAINTSGNLVINRTGISGLGAVAGNISGTGNVTINSLDGTTFSVNKTIGLTGSSSVLNISTAGNLTLDASISSNGTLGAITLIAGTNGASATSGNVNISSTSIFVNLSSGGTLSVLSGNNTRGATVNLTSFIEGRVNGAGTSSTKKYKTYNATSSSLSSAVAGTRNYFYRLAPASLTASNVTATKVYDGSTSFTGNISGTLSGTLNAEDAAGMSLYANAGSFLTKDVGTNKALSLSSVSLSNSTWGISGYSVTVSGSPLGNITAKNLSLSIPGGTKVYDGNTNITLTGPVSLSGIVSGDNVTLSTGNVTGFVDKNVGVNKTVYWTGFALSGTDYLNYNLPTTANSTESITAKPITITGITAANKVYDGTNTSTVSTAAVTNAYLLSAGVVAGDVLTVSSTGVFDDRNAGNGKTVTLNTTYGGTDAGNYNITSPASVLANITAKAVTLSAPSVSRAYDGTTDYAASAAQLTTLSGLLGVAGDGVTAITLTYDNKNAGTGKTLTPSSATISDGNNGLNYNISYASNSNSVITAKAITISGFAAVDKVYDGTANATINTSAVTRATLIAAGALGSDDINLSAATGLFRNGLDTANDKNVGTNKLVALTANYSGADAGNYNITNQISNRANITAKDVTLAAPQASRAYDGTYNYTANATDLAALTTALGVSGDNVSAITLVYDNKNTGTGRTLTPSSATINDGNSGANYNVSYANNTASVITAKNVTLTAPQASRTYDGTVDYTANATQLAALSTQLGVAGDSVTAITLTYNDKAAATGKTLTPSNATVADGNGGANYNISFATNTASVITQKAITISGFTALDKAYDGTANATIDASTANNMTALVAAGLIAGDNVSASATGVFRNSGNNASDKNVGTNKPVLLTSAATGADAGNYNITIQGSTTANITAKNVVLTAPQASREYDGTVNYTVNATQLSALSTQLGVTGDNVTAITLAYTNKNAGTGKTLTGSHVVISDGNSGLNYNISYADNTTSVITPKNLTLVVPGGTREYDGTSNISFNGTVNITGIIGADNVSLSTGNVTAYVDKNVGTNKAVYWNGFQLTGADAINYNLPVAANSTESITAKAITISGITAANKTYDGNTTAVVNVSGVNSTTLIGMGMIAGDDLSVSATGVFNNKNAGTGKTVTLSSNYTGADAGNYNITSQVNTTAAITAKAVTLAAPQATRTYDGSVSYTANATQLAALSTQLGVTGDSVTAITLAYDNKNAGTGKTLTASGAVVSDGNNGANYNVSYSVNTTSVITPKDVTLTAPQATRAYDGTMDYTANATQLAALSTQLGVVGDSVSNIILSYNSKNAGTGKTLTASGASISDGNSGGNYNVSYTTNTTSVITPKDVTLAAPQATRAYDGTMDYTANATQLAALSTQLGVAGDSVSNIILAYNNKNAATGKTLTASSASISDGNGGGNYNVSYTTNTNSVITPKDVTLAAPQATRAYDGTVDYTANATQLAALSTQLGVTGDNVTAITLAYNSKNAATGKTLTASSASISDGNSGGNYNVSYSVNTTSVITPKDVTLAAPQATRTYDGTVDYTVNATQLAALSTQLGVAGDSVSNITLVYNNKNAATGKTLTASSAAISDGNSGGNYNVSYTTNTNSVITQKNLRLVIPGGTKEYDGTSNITFNGAISITDIIGTDNVSLGTGNVTSYVDKNVGTNKAVYWNGFQLLGVDAGNYNLPVTANSTESITPKVITIAGITAANKVYDGNTTAVVNVSAVNSTSLVGMGMIAGDDLNVSAAGVFDTKHAGTGKTVTLTSNYTGTDAGNYNITSQATTTADVTQKSLSISGITAANKAYDGNTTAIVNVSAVNTTSLVGMGMISGDDVSVSATGVFTDKEVGTNKIVNISTVYRGADAGNYHFMSQTSTLANITSDSKAGQADSGALYKSLPPVTTPPTTPVTRPAPPTVPPYTSSASTSAVSATVAEPVAAPSPTTTAPTVVASVAPASESRAASNAMPVSQASTASHAGVLPVSVLGDTRVSNLGMAYEEQPNDIRIQMTTSPDVPKLTATAIRFTGNFKTFIVNNDRGEMVPYQGAMIGKRIVILAETEASKNLARQEMQTVLAAAITTLGSSGSISLAQVEGVVLDLR